MQEFAEHVTGARLHVNLAFVQIGYDESDTNFDFSAVIDILLQSVLAIKVSYNRLFSNFQTSRELC